MDDFALHPNLPNDSVPRGKTRPECSGPGGGRHGQCRVQGADTQLCSEQISAFLTLSAAQRSRAAALSVPAGAEQSWNARSSTYMIDVHTERGYTEVLPPFIAKRRIAPQAPATCPNSKRTCFAAGQFVVPDSNCRSSGDEHLPRRSPETKRTSPSVTWRTRRASPPKQAHTDRNNTGPDPSPPII